MNSLIKKVKRVGHGLRNFDNYRLRLLPNCGVHWQTAQPARIRSRLPLGCVEPGKGLHTASDADEIIEWEISVARTARTLSFVRDVGKGSS
jgi:hypothetical protein